ncbi:hypothetical protein GUITHDRAFT_142364 [Guillardia theta CCMP2712]|uniref:Uncharacterized protein n=1 Tax=Guillardia theta (strain CCMP2712) TaxID=905079 RepID=L1IYI4_GUITC|nr:hypothetical protein GUITHDRAFT_142364 [Guillardia theta CCMP2712]EKX40964.1 hypothetical protein GUITHDRAFT_142364 [Guillardia theta CCMP2712]|eukprot:XP_005827944.1 hypothetical protein GUITHDRAFT_142364 [Guillardia theta CCMP2712]
MVLMEFSRRRSAAKAQGPGAGAMAQADDEGVSGRGAAMRGAGARAAAEEEEAAGGSIQQGRMGMPLNQSFNDLPGNSWQLVPFSIAAIFMTLTVAAAAIWMVAKRFR